MSSKEFNEAYWPIRSRVLFCRKGKGEGLYGVEWGGIDHPGARCGLRIFESVGDIV